MMERLHPEKGVRDGVSDAVPVTVICTALGCAHMSPLKRYGLGLNRHRGADGLKVIPDVDLYNFFLHWARRHVIMAFTSISIMRFFFFCSCFLPHHCQAMGLKSTI